MTLVLSFGAVAQQCDMPPAREPLDQAQRERLPVILDAAAARIDRPIHEQFGAVTASEFGPRHAISQPCLEKSLARSQGWHPDVITAGRQAPAAKTRHQNSKTVGVSADRTPDRFGLEHLVPDPFIVVSPTPAMSRALR